MKVIVKIDDVSSELLIELASKHLEEMMNNTELYEQEKADCKEELWYHIDRIMDLDMIPGLKEGFLTSFEHALINALEKKSKERGIKGIINRVNWFKIKKEAPSFRKARTSLRKRIGMIAMQFMIVLVVCILATAAYEISIYLWLLGGLLTIAAFIIGYLLFG